MASYRLNGEYSARRDGVWEQRECVITVAEGWVAIDQPGAELQRDDVVFLEQEVHFHRGWIEVTPGLKQLKVVNRYVYNAITAKYPVRPDQAYLMEGGA